MEKEFNPIDYVGKEYKLTDGRTIFFEPFDLSYADCFACTINGSKFHIDFVKIQEMIKNKEILTKEELKELQKNKGDRTMSETKVCKRCGRELPIEQFSKNNKSKDGYQCYCKECLKNYNRENYHKKKEDNNHLKLVYTRPDLAIFTPRELMAELKARGYQWDYMLEPQRKIDFNKI